MTLHTALSVQIARQLTPLLPERYTALLNEWFITALPESDEGVAITTGSGYPDAYVTEVNPRRPNEPATSATLIAPAPMRLATAMPETMRHITVELRDIASRRVVTAIEVLSPFNKRGRGRAEYLRKRRRVLLSSSHLIEIDLLRRGRRLPMRDPLPHADYFVLVSRAASRPLTDVWPVQIDEPLPTIPTPLLESDADVPLNLQQAFTGVYDDLRCDRNVDYSAPPRVELDIARATWARDRIRAWNERRL
jgi:hypothetical protein